MFVTGQMPFCGTPLESGSPPGIEAQTHQVMRNLAPVLRGCGLGKAARVEIDFVARRAALTPRDPP